MILVNARLEELAFSNPEQRAFFFNEFERIYHLKPNPLPGWNGAVLFRSFPVHLTQILPVPPRTCGNSPSPFVMSQLSVQHLPWSAVCLGGGLPLDTSSESFGPDVNRTRQRSAAGGPAQCGTAQGGLAATEARSRQTGPGTPHGGAVARCRHACVVEW